MFELIIVVGFVASLLVLINGWVTDREWMAARYREEKQAVLERARVDAEIAESKRRWLLDKQLNEYFAKLRGE